MSAKELAAMRRDTGNAAHFTWLRATLCPPRTKGNALVLAYTELCGDPKAAALELNRARQLGYTARSIGIWRRGERSVPDRVRDVMRMAILRSRFPPALADAFMQLLDIHPVAFEKGDAAICEIP